MDDRRMSHTPGDNNQLFVGLRKAMIWNRNLVQIQLIDFKTSKKAWTHLSKGLAKAKGL